PKTARTRTPRIATRVRKPPTRRGGSATAGGAPRPFAVVLAKETHLRRELGELRRPQQAPAERVHRRRQREVEQDRREEREQQEIRSAAQELEAVQDRHLDERGDEEDRPCLDGVGGHRQGSWALRTFGTSTITDSSDEKSTNGLTWMSL